MRGAFALLVAGILLGAAGCAGDPPALPPETGATIATTASGDSTTTGPVVETSDDVTSGATGVDSFGSGSGAGGCTGDVECGGATPACDPVSGECVPCLPGGGHCPVDSYCDPATLQCVPGCDDDGDCDGATPICDTSTGICVACVDDGDCSAPTPACDTTANVCVECLVDGNCSAAAPVCDAAANVCVECLGDGDCNPGQCTANVCVSLGFACAGNGDCDVGGGEECCTSLQCMGTCMIPCSDPGDCPPMDPAMGCAHGYCLFPCSVNADCTEWPGYTCQHMDTLCEND